MTKKTWFVLLLAIISACMLTACGGASDIEYDSIDAAKEALNQAQTIYIEGNYDSVKQKSDILADGNVAAYLKGRTVIIDGETWFSIRFVTDEWINEDGDDYSAGTTYGYYDADGNCLGYAQKRGMGEDGEYTYNFYFMDAEGNLKPYSIGENGYYAWDADGNVIATGDWGSDFFKISLMNDDCHVQIDMAEDASTQMDFMDKMVMYLRLFDEADFWLGD